LGDLRGRVIERKIQMENELASIARRTATLLAPEFGPELPHKVEQAFAEDPFEKNAERIVDPISVASLIVSLVALGWTIYHDSKGDREAARRDQHALAQRLATRLQDGEDEIRGLTALTTEQKDRVIDVVAREIVNAGDKRS